MARIQEDPRIDQRLKAAFSAPPAAGLPNGQLQSLWSGDGLYERDYWLTSSPDSNQVALRFARPAGAVDKNIVMLTTIEVSILKHFSP